MDKNYQNTHMTTTTTTATTTTTTTTFSSLESSGSDQHIDLGVDFEVSDFLSLENWAMAESGSMGFGQNQSLGCQGSTVCEVGGTSNIQNEGENSMGSYTDTKGAKERVAFRMKSEDDVVEDGYKWRKYGKKMVKNSPNPRHYYKCSVDDCPVKKRVERDREDPTYVITTYEGHHNHEAPKQ